MPFEARPISRRRFTADPLVPEDRWDWFSLRGLRIQGIQGCDVDVRWDRNGQHYGCGDGLPVTAGGVETETLRCTRLVPTRNEGATSSNGSSGPYTNRNRRRE